MRRDFLLDPSPIVLVHVIQPTISGRLRRLMPDDLQPHLGYLNDVPIWSDAPFPVGRRSYPGPEERRRFPACSPWELPRGRPKRKRAARSLTSLAKSWRWRVGTCPSAPRICSICSRIGEPSVMVGVRGEGARIDESRGAFNRSSAVLREFPKMSWPVFFFRAEAIFARFANLRFLPASARTTVSMETSACSANSCCDHHGSASRRFLICLARPVNTAAFCRTYISGASCK
jgi:hypothetical protein